MPGPTETTYWVSAPHSAEPPAGPFDILTLIAKANAGEISSESTVCKVGEALWVPLHAVLPKSASLFSPVGSAGEAVSRSPAPSATPSAPAVIEPERGKPEKRQEQGFDSREKIESRYENLASVARYLKAYGIILQKLGIICVIVGGVAAVVISLENGYWAKVACVFVAILGVFIYVAGIIVAAVGEAMSALKDIAVNTRIVSDRAERANG